MMSPEKVAWLNASYGSPGTNTPKQKHDLFEYTPQYKEKIRFTYKTM